MALNGSPTFCLKLTYWYLLKADHGPGDTWRGVIFRQGHNLNKLGRGPLGDATYQNIKALGLMVSDKKIFFLYKPMVNMRPLGRAIFGPRNII